MLSDDVLPQPYRFINKLVNRCIDDAFEGIRKRQLAQQSHRQFNPPKTLHVHPADDIPILVTASDQPIPGGPLRPAEPTASFAGSSSLLYGFKQGRVTVHSAGTGDVLGIIAVHATAPIAALAAAGKHCVFAAAADNTITLFYALNEETAAAQLEASQALQGQPSLTANGDGEGEVPVPATPVVSQSEMPPPSHTLAVWLTIDQSDCPQLATSAIQDLTLSDDAAHLAVVLGNGEEVLCIRLPSPELVLRGDALKGDEDTTPILAFSAKPPANALVDAQKLSLHLMPVCEFIVRDSALAAHATMAFGGHARPNGTPLTQHLCIAWCGTNVFSTYALREASPLSAPPPPLNFDAAAEAKAAQMAAEIPSPVQGGKGGGKGAKQQESAAPPAAAPAAQAAAQNASGAAVAAVSTPTPGVPFTPVDVPFSGERHRYLSHFISTASLCRATPIMDLFSIGCFDGTVYVWSAVKLSFVWTFEDAPHRAAQKSVNQLLVTNVAFHKGTHLIVGLALPLGNIVPSATDHSRIVVWNLTTGQRVSSVDYVPRVSWVGTCRSLPVFVFAAAGAVFAADLYSGSLVSKLELPAVASTCLLPKTTDVNMLLEHCAQVRRIAPQDLGHCISISAIFKNDAGDVRRRRHLLDVSQLIFAAYPVIEQYAHRFSNDQLGYMLAKLTDPSDRHKANIVASIVPPGVLLTGDATRKSTGSAATGLAGVGGRAASVANSAAGLARAVETPASTVKSNGVKPASKKTAPSTTNGRNPPFGAALFSAAPVAAVEKVQRLVDQREASKTQRDQRFKALWTAMQP